LHDFSAYPDLSMTDQLVLRDISAYPELIEKTFKENFAEWGPPFDLTGYLGREKALGSCAFARDMSTWALVSATNPDEVLCSCESYNRPCVVR
jgi:hypothetical protein